jgi:glycine cleavage system H protein
VQVNSEPYTGGWFLKVKLSDKGELDRLMDSKTYEKHCADGGH